MFVEKMDRYFYPNLKNNWDDDIFRAKVLVYLKPEMALLDVGAGVGRIPQMNFKGKCKRIVGIDPDSSVLKNENVDESVVSCGEKMPFEAESFDMAISDNVWEHVDKPIEFLQEVWRVLKPGGLYLAKTPNSFHYIPLIAKITPHWFHKFYNSLRGRSHEDTFKTHYKLNSRGSISKHALMAGFEIE